MKVLILSDANSIHTQRWVSGLSGLNIDVALWSIAAPNSDFYDKIEGVNVYHSSVPQQRFGFFAKIKYLSLVGSVKEAIKRFQPDILHAHYASSFGLLGALSNFRPFILSIWGSDVFEFPLQNTLFRRILQYNFKKADILLSTSHALALEASKYTNKPFRITPFGIDLQLFSKLFMTENKIFTVGTVKTLEKKYGIDLLIDAFYAFKKKLPGVCAKLRIVGKGSLRKQLEQQVANLGLSNDCEFVGGVTYEQVPRELEKMDVCVCLSRSESFGVAAIEASAMGLPVVVSNAGGLPEVIQDGVTGIVIPEGNAELAADALVRLYHEEELRLQMGKAGRDRVQEEYNWKENLLMMKMIYGEAKQNF